ncbi:MAG TPA: hypothetical protein VKP68_14230, partial [Ramlibacter sp.]|nr:hypothetical protein [Ramlibacter sp.]
MNTRMSRTHSALIFILLLVAATIAIYFPSLGNELVFDDRRLTDGSIFGVFGNILELRPRMLSFGSFVWLKSLVGDSWRAQRLVNVILHVGVALGLYGLFTQLLSCQRFSQERQS